MQTVSLIEDFSHLHELAHTHHEGRSSISLHDGESCVLRQTVTSLLAGRSMKVERPPVEGWILVIEGHVQLVISDSLNERVDAPMGTLMQLPRESFELTAQADSLLLLTVAMGDRPRGGSGVTHTDKRHHVSTASTPHLDPSEYAREVWEDESPAQGELLQQAPS